MSWFSNFNRFLAKGSALASNMILFLHVITALAQFTAFVTSLAAKTPLVDAAVAMIPGLASMFRINNNFELDRLRAVQDARIEYYAVKCQFQPEDPGWKVWRYFVDSSVERAVCALFPNENDWVVNTVSMTERLQLPQARAKDLGARSDSHHTSYFHVVFTLPEEPSELTLRNKKVSCQLLFQTSAASLLEVAADPLSTKRRGHGREKSEGGFVEAMARIADLPFSS